ncbi:hypothetical protein DBZ36_07865 [Alginatibacterium sediminis]|uniref:VCBS repeat-containing protein n=1 Tax=Alginatibacterium sediminis TaxID=2164068 RepID=A0A420EIF0_9ALTE|nr:hypothetical protein [Alginatibacterium sediminis]RKF20346.1 hypothetical protein DBZ36_07865 [Alginatibacterium sediminis]
MKTRMVIFLLLNLGLSAQADERPTDVAATVITEAVGDLDNDGIAEKVVVLDTGLASDFGTQRAVLIYQNVGEQWRLWFYSEEGVLSSAHGGMFGDPFLGIEIERGALVINHFGGSMQKWSYVHRFRFNDGNWDLIGATIEYGLLECEYVNFDFNIVTGKAIYTDVNEACREGEIPNIESHELTIELDDIPRLDSFYPGNTELYLSDIDKMIYY